MEIVECLAGYGGDALDRGLTALRQRRVSYRVWRAVGGSLVLEDGYPDDLVATTRRRLAQGG